jgi:hypothetical protein
MKHLYFYAGYYTTSDNEKESFFGTLEREQLITTSAQFTEAYEDICSDMRFDLVENEFMEPGSEILIFIHTFNFLGSKPE